MSDTRTLHISKPMMPGKYDAIYAEVDLRDGYRAIAYDSDPYVEVTILKAGKPLFTAFVADYKEALPTIEKNIEDYIAQVEAMS